MLTILYFASVREKLGTSKEEINFDDKLKTLADIKKVLSQRGDDWQQVFKKNNQILSSINQVIAKDTETINNNDEIAFFPQVTGG